AELDRLELTPAEQVRALLRLADAEQYRQKLAGKDTTLPTRARVPGSRRTAADFRELADAVNALVQGIIADPGTIGHRLARTAARCGGRGNGRAGGGGETKGDLTRDGYGGPPRAGEMRAAKGPPPPWAPRGSRLSASPASARAVTGGSFVADALQGDDAE